MTNRERAMAALNYETYDKLPVVHFGFWRETLEKWAAEGHIPQELAHDRFGQQVAEMLGFDFEWGPCFGLGTNLRPHFTRRIVKDFDDGRQHIRNSLGVTELHREGATSIPQEISHLLVDRESWEDLYLPRLQLTKGRVPVEALREFRQAFESDSFDLDRPRGLFAGSLYGDFRNWAGVTGTSYIYADDEELYAEIVNTLGRLCGDVLEEALELCVPGMFDFGHFWEDICFKTGPLVVPSVFNELVGPHYRRMTGLLKEIGVEIVSLDCDGCIDALLPTWLNNGVNTMFPIEVGTWEASIAPWREQHGRELRGVGGMNKNVFAKDFDAVEEEIARLKPLVDLGGFIPCPDHRIAPDAKWENVVYYCKRMRETF